MMIKKNFDKLDVSAGLRYDSRSFHNDAMYVCTNPQTNISRQVNIPDTLGSINQFSKYAKVFSGITGSAGLTYNFTDNFSVKANIARGFRAPNISEIAANGVHPGTDMYQIGDVNKPEFSLQEDLGFFLNFDHANGYVEIFNNNITNYVFNQKLLSYKGQDSISAGNPTYKFQQSNAELYGGEASLDIHPHPLDWLHFENSISIVYAINKGGNGVHITDSTKYLPFIPPIHTHSELRADVKGKVGRFAFIYAKIEMEHYAAQNRAYTSAGTETPTPGYTFFGAGVGADVLDKNGKKLFNIQVLGSNITNVVYQSNMSRLKYMDFYINKAGSQVNQTGTGTGIYNMGRNISFKISVPLDL